MKASELRKKFRNEYRERNVLKRVGGLVKIISDLIKNRSSDAVVIREGKDITVVSYGEHFYQDRRVKDLQDYCMTHFIGGRGTEGLTETIQEELNKFPLSVLLVVSVEMLNRHGDYEILFHSYSSQ